ncbi:ABC transporter ATP-binding protein [Denitromonas iodatirespirans]|uniref:ABC transporter ATP-binding protein n=1 Tax=Denitromonas iodatirespirans TaxID=2795389 RepID=A0A944DCK7_DENI1|nr:ABC transporter ATP-binding protein [Denitromonas iodatirespirans]MBT0962571.1 ABC transporter ATP-binding protein [Denitromonas iodatirespirans]
MNALDVTGVSVGRGGCRRVDAVSLSVARGELFGLIGPNGAGKTSLLRAVAQLTPHEGEVRVGGAWFAALSPAQRATRLAYLGQDDRAAWPMSVADFVALGRLPHRRAWARGPSAADTAAVQAAMAAMRLGALAGRRLDQLSGGERTRARLARALAVQAPLLLADEPIAALDPFHQLSVMNLLREHCARGGSIVVVLHDLTLASRFCDRVLLMHQGCAVAAGTPRQVLTPGNLQRVYQVQAMHGEHDDQSYVLPWQCRPLTPSEIPA